MLAGYVDGRLDEHGADPLATDLHTEDGGSIRGNLSTGSGNLDATRLAPSAGSHLGLYDDRTTEELGDCLSLLGRAGDVALGHRNPEPTDVQLPLVFEEVH